jgi:glyoxylase-like metal-dependent hydrolase (beta-lactamase superfamily II)
LIIDPVLERVERYLQLVRELDLKLVKTVDTHLHADHVPGLGALRIAIEDESLIHLSPIGWEHVNLTGDYTWQAAGRLRKGGFRPLRPFAASNE